MGHDGQPYGRAREPGQAATQLDAGFAHRTPASRRGSCHWRSVSTTPRSENAFTGFESSPCCPARKAVLNALQRRGRTHFSQWQPISNEHAIGERILRPLSEHRTMTIATLRPEGESLEC
jgi:hypothetical protein